MEREWTAWAVHFRRPRRLKLPLASDDLTLGMPRVHIVRPVALRMAVILPLVFGTGRLQAENFTKVEIEGKSIVLDVDSSAVQRYLKPANPEANVTKLPAWLFPSPGQAPLRSNYDPNTGIASAAFASTGTVDQIVAYYGQLMASKGYATGPLPPPGPPTTRILSGKGAGATISVLASPARAGGTEFTVTYAPKPGAANRKHFEVAWFDPARTRLCLRDAASGEEYYLDAPGILQANLNRPGAVKSEGAPYPSWFPIYPGAQRATAKIMMLLMEPTATFQTHDSIHAVYDFYRTALEAAGAKLGRQSLSRSGNPVKDFSAEIVAQKGDDVVEIEVGEIHDPNPARVMQGEKLLEGTGIGVRYTVPKR
jgi:hypothetical protein